MKVLIVNTYDVGGPAKASLRLHNGLLENGINSKVLLRFKSKNIQNSFQFGVNKTPSLLKKNHKKIIKRLNKINIYRNIFLRNQQFIKSRDSRLDFFSFPTSEFDITTSPLYKEADIINLHWVSNFLDYPNFFQKNKKPIVWTLHDMNPFLGGEHYNEKYLGIDKNGFPVKRILNQKERRQFELIINKKNKALRNCSNINIVTLCNWMTQEVKKSELFNNFETHLIPNGIDSQIFKPKNKVSSRELLNLPKDKKIVLFVADSIKNNRKGFEFLKNTMNDLDRKDTVLCTIGKNHSEFESQCEIFNLGRIDDEQQLSAAYSAADVFVIPSLMDNLPNTILESLLCGTPVIGFPVGGILDLIQHGENGYITTEISVDALKEQLNNFLNNSSQFDSQLIRTNAVKKYDKNVQSENYINLFKKILNK